MAEIITVHSARAAAGKSTIVANLAVLYAAAGRRVGLVDTDLRNSGLHLFFGVPQTRLRHTFNDYLLGTCDGTECVYDVTPPAVSGGRIVLIPASTDMAAAHQVGTTGYAIERITDDLVTLVERSGLDILLIDTHAGVHEEMLLSLLAMAITHTLVVVLRLDARDYQATAVVVDVARQLGVPRIAMVANQIVSLYDPGVVRQRLAQSYAAPVATLLPYSEEIAALGSSDLFVLRYPEHRATLLLNDLARALLRHSAPARAEPAG